ncbi:MAG: hypothetical protein FJY97_08995 [candidate division Zixibacteria bacterium]|nr:hypothetical protein [candidate division Zixibacteria bacterium]
MWVQRILLDHVLTDTIVSISDVVTSHLVEERGVSPDRIVKIFNPVDTDRFHPGVSGVAVRQELGIPGNAVVIGNVSRFEKLKGYDRFLDIAAALIPEEPTLYFLMVGHGPEETPL